MAETVVVTGGGGYVGSVLVPKLLGRGHSVRVLDAFFYGDQGLAPVRGHPNLEIYASDLRDRGTLEAALDGATAVVHLASISNDPSAELDPILTQTVNYDAVVDLVGLARAAGVARLINASSGSIYGVKEEEEVTEELVPAPMTLYAELKARSEEPVRAANDRNFATVSIRSATVCGYSPRMRLDLTVNLLTSLAVNRGRITVFGGEQQRANIHIDDITELYALLVDVPPHRFSGEVFNAVGENHSVMAIAETVREIVGSHIELERISTNDHRSYRLSGAKLARALGFVAKHTIREAIVEVREAFEDGRLHGHDNPAYHNLVAMQALGFGRPRDRVSAR